MQQKRADSDRFYQISHKSRFIDPIGLKFVPKVSRLLELQLLRRTLWLEMLLWSPKLACKFMHGFSEIPENLKHETLTCNLHLLHVLASLKPH